MEKKNKTNKKKFQFKITKNMVAVICGIGVILLLLAVPSTIIKKDNNKLNKKIQYSLEKTRLITVAKNGLYGFLDYKGNEVTKVEYNYVVDYSGKYAITSKDSKYYLINEKGKVVKESDEAIQYDEVNDTYVIDGRLYNNKIKPISNKTDKIYSVGYGYYRFETSDGKKTGIMNRKGKKVYTEKKNEKGRINVFINEVDDINKNVYCAITPDGGIFTLINCDTGKTIIKYSSDVILANGNNIFQVKSKDSYKNIFVKNDKIVLETKDAPRMIFVSKGYIVYKEKEDGEYKYFDVKTNKVYDDEPVGYDQINRSDFEDQTDIARINSNGKYGLIKGDKVIVPCEYDKISFFAYDLFNVLAKHGKHYVIVRSGKSTYLYDIKTNKRVKKFATNENINSLADSTFIYYNKSNKIHVYNLLTGKENSYDADSVEIFGNYIKVHKGDQVTYFDRNLNKIYGSTEVENVSDNPTE